VTLAELRDRLAQRAKDAAAMHAEAPVADVLGVVLADLEAVDGAGEAPADRLLDVTEAARLLDVRPRWLYDHAKTLPFTRKLGGRTLRFSEAGLRRWLERKRAA
jgi:predicted DNA-binding transcriptional regulator AlpA